MSFTPAAGCCYTNLDPELELEELELEEEEEESEPKGTDKNDAAKGGEEGVLFDPVHIGAW